MRHDHRPARFHHRGAVYGVSSSATGVMFAIALCGACVGAGVSGVTAEAASNSAAVGSSATPARADDALAEKAARLVQEAHQFRYGDDDHAQDVAKAVDLYEAASATAPESPPAAQALAALAELYESGSPDGTVSVDLVRAVQLYNSSALLGNPSAQFVMGVLHAHGLYGVPLNEALAVVHYRYAAVNGDVRAQMALGHRYTDGIGVKKSCSVAATYYELAANTAVDEYMAAVSYPMTGNERLADDALDTLGRGDNNFELVQYYMNAAEKGDMQARLMMGHMRYSGLRGVEQDFVAAAEDFRVAAVQEEDNSVHAAAKANLGHMYAEGLGVPRDDDVAVELFMEAMQPGNAAAVNGMGVMYLSGRGVSKVDTDRALEYFKQASDAGNVEAMYNLASMYLSGTGVKRDYSKAHQLLGMAGHHGHMLALHKLAQMHRHGLGTARSCTRAVQLFKVVSERGPWISLLSEAGDLVTAGQADRALLIYARAAEQGYEVAAWNAAWLLHHRFATLAAAMARNAATAALPQVSSNSDQTDDEGTNERREGSRPGGAAHLVEEEEIAAKALRFFLRSANQGNVEAHLRVGDYHYYGGGGLTADPAKAAVHYRTAADMRHPQAMFNIGYMHEHGIGLQRDHHLAKRFYDMAAETSPSALVPVTLATTKMWLVDAFEDWYAGVSSDSKGPKPDDSDGQLRAAPSPLPSSAPEPEKPRRAWAKGASAKGVLQGIRDNAKAYYDAVVSSSSDDKIVAVLCVLFVAVLMVRGRRRAMAMRPPPEAPG